MRQGMQAENGSTERGVVEAEMRRVLQHFGIASVGPIVRGDGRKNPTTEEISEASDGCEELLQSFDKVRLRFEKNLIEFQTKYEEMLDAQERRATVDEDLNNFYFLTKIALNASASIDNTRQISLADIKRDAYEGEKVLQGDTMALYNRLRFMFQLFDFLFKQEKLSYYLAQVIGKDEDAHKR